jgi:hypothetical protein
MNLLFHNLTSVNADLPSRFRRRFVLYDAVYQGIQGMVPTDPDIVPGMNPGAPLAHQYRARQDCLPGISLYAQPLGIGVPTVPAGAATFLMSHAA